MNNHSIYEMAIYFFRSFSKTCRKSSQEEGNKTKRMRIGQIITIHKKGNKQNCNIKFIFYHSKRVVDTVDQTLQDRNGVTF